MKYKIPLLVSLAGFGLSALLLAISLLTPMLVVKLEGINFLLLVLIFVPLVFVFFSEPDFFGSVEKKKQAQEKFRRSLPQWAKYMSALLFVNIMANMVFSVVVDGTRSPMREGNRYFLHDQNSSQETPLTLPQYAIYKARQARILTSFTLLFYFVPACYFGLYKSKSGD